MAVSGGDGTEDAGARTVFISYASLDAATANSVVEYLERHELRCWLAPRDVEPGTQYADAIVRALNDSSVLVLVLSANSVASSHVAREVERAASKRRPIIAFKIDSTSLVPALEYFLGESQWIDVSAIGMPAALIKLADAVRARSQPVARAATATPVASRGANRSTTLLAIAAVVACVIVAAALAVYSWTQSRVAVHPPAMVIADKSIAVLPFVDLSENQDQEYFADGTAEEILDLLANIPGLTVIGRTSSFQFKSKNEDLRVIGAKLGAAFIVEGSVRRAGPRIRVTAQLIEARSGAHRWSESYDRDFGDILALQSDIATGIARALQLSVDVDESSQQRHLPNTEAYALYLRGLLAQDQQGIEKLFEAVRDFEQALALNPKFLRAAEALARARVDEGFDEAVMSREAWRNAREAARRALVIDSHSATAHAVLGLVHAEEEFDWNAASAEFDQALALNPRDPTALGYAAIVAGARGLTVDSQRLFGAALAVDPLNPYIQQHFGQMLVAAGDFAAARIPLEKSIAINASFDGNHYQLCKMHLARGEIEAALKEIQLEPSVDAKDAGLAMSYHGLHRSRDSDASLARLIRTSGDAWPYSVATVYAYRGERDQAIAWLKKGLETRDSDELEGIRGDPEFAALRHDARYNALLHEMKLPD